MPNYGYEALEGSTVSLPSGAWCWYRSRLLEMPNRVCRLQTLVLAHLDVAGSIMRLQVDPTENLDDDKVAVLALDPDERFVVFSGEQYRVRSASEDEPELMWRVEGPNRSRWMCDWEIETPLGALTEADMHVLVSIGIT